MCHTRVIVIRVGLKIFDDERLSDSDHVSSKVSNEKWYVRDDDKDVKSLHSYDR